MFVRFSAFLIVFSITVANALAQSQPEFKKQNFNYSEWTKGKFSEAVTVTNVGKFIFLAGTGAENEVDGKILYPEDFTAQCRYAYAKIKKMLELQGATMNDVVRIVTYTTDVRNFQDALKCRAEAWLRSDSGFYFPGGQPTCLAIDVHRDRCDSGAIEIMPKRY